MRDNAVRNPSAQSRLTVTRHEWGDLKELESPPIQGRTFDVVLASDAWPPSMPLVDSMRALCHAGSTVFMCFQQRDTAHSDMWAYLDAHFLRREVPRSEQDATHQAVDLLLYKLTPINKENSSETVQTTTKKESSTTVDNNISSNINPNKNIKMNSKDDFVPNIQVAPVHSGLSQLDGAHAALFDDAYEFMARSSLALSADTQLRLFALAQQAVHGPFEDSAFLAQLMEAPGGVAAGVSELSADERRQIEAWQQVGELARVDAIKSYVEMVRGFAPGFRSELATLKKGACPQTLRSPSAAASLCELAAANDYLEVARRLAAGEAVNTFDEEGRCALHWACDRGHHTLARMLLEQKADVNARDGEGLSPLHYAVSCDFEQVARMLLEFRADPTLADADGETPLAAAVGRMKSLLRARDS